MQPYIIDNERLLRTGNTDKTRRLMGSASTSRITSSSSGIRAIPVIRRTESEKNEHHDRLSLDGRDLLLCPVLENEDQLKLLSFENNYIRSIERLSLQNLVFLNFYNNNLQTLSGLDAVPNLRVLLLGRNNLKCIQNLFNLPLLDVLDLHSNCINRIENIQQLKSLRILNLEHNRIERVSRISGMAALVEINLSHNQISHISPLSNLPSLQRLFLSHNRIDSVSAVEELGCIHSLIELTLKWNPITGDLPLMENFTKSLTNLTAFDLWSEGSRPSGAHLDSWPDVQSDDQQIDRNSESDGNEQKGANAHTFSSHVDAKTAPWSITLQRIQQWWERIQDSLDYLDGRDVPSYYKFEDNKSKIIIFGFGFQALELDQAAHSQCVSFNYVPFNSIIPFFNKLITWPHLKRLEFSNNAIVSFRQFDSLSIFMRVVELSITANPILNISLHKQYLLFSMKNLKTYNDEPVTVDQIATANLRFSKRWPKCNRNALRTKKILSTSAVVRHAEISAPQAFNSIVSFVSTRISTNTYHVSNPCQTMCQQSCTDVSTKFRFFFQTWPDCCSNFVKSCLSDQ